MFPNFVVKFLPSFIPSAVPIPAVLMHFESRTTIGTFPSYDHALATARFPCFPFFRSIERNFFSVASSETNSLRQILGFRSIVLRVDLRYLPQPDRECSYSETSEIPNNWRSKNWFPSRFARYRFAAYYNGSVTASAIAACTRFRSVSGYGRCTPSNCRFWTDLVQSSQFESERLRLYSLIKLNYCLLDWARSSVNVAISSGFIGETDCRKINRNSRRFRNALFDRFCGDATFRSAHCCPIYHGLSNLNQFSPMMLPAGQD